MFVQSSVEQVKGGRYVDYSGPLNVANSYNGFPPNNIINMDLIFTFYKGNVEIDSLAGMFISVIIFETIQGNKQYWHYPPGIKGDKQRNDDFDFLRHRFTTKRMAPKE